MVFVIIQKYVYLTIWTFNLFNDNYMWDIYLVWSNNHAQNAAYVYLQSSFFRTNDAWQTRSSSFHSCKSIGSAFSLNLLESTFEAYIVYNCMHLGNIRPCIFLPLVLLVICERILINLRFLNDGLSYFFFNFLTQLLVRENLREFLPLRLKISLGTLIFRLMIKDTER